MLSSFQRRSRFRKLGYSVGILLLLTGTLGWRLAVVDAYAERLRLREADIGQVELTGKTVQLLSTGVRGLVVCGLWYATGIEYARKDWPELERITDTLTVLQPHMIIAWLYQSWNVTYNVSVISDQATDQYYHIARGILLLADGERKNQNHPDIRFYMGYYYQDKFGMADKRREYRALYEMSCIDPRYRSAAWLRPEGKVDLERFEQFCKDHPMAVRRIRQIPGHQTPDEVIDFLEANFKARIPSRYEDQSDSPLTTPSKLKEPEKRFPILPPGVYDAEEPSPDNGLFDNFAAAREWFRYAQDPLPPPVPRPVPGIFDYDRTKYRLPRYMATILFRGYPAHAQTYLAKRLEEEGWFDQDGWVLTDRDGFPELGVGKDGETRTVRVGGPRPWAELAWQRAFTLRRDYGLNNGLLIEDVPLANLRARARPYQDYFQLDPNRDFPVEPPAELRNRFQDGFEAFSDLYWYGRNRSLANFDHFYFEAMVEAEPLTVAARKAFFEAERLGSMASNLKALEMYTNPPYKELARYKEPKALEAWKDLLLRHREFRRDNWVQQDTYKIHRNYLKRALEEVGDPLLYLAHYEAEVGAGYPGLLVRPPVKLQGGLRRLGRLQVKGPLDVNDLDGRPLIGEAAIQGVRVMEEMMSPQPQAPPPEAAVDEMRRRMQQMGGGPPPP
jgi:hypothetical protein